MLAQGNTTNGVVGSQLMNRDSVYHQPIEDDHIAWLHQIINPQCGQSYGAHCGEL
jgi:hypothetical protein